MPDPAIPEAPRLIAFVGTYTNPADGSGGGIHTFAVTHGGTSLTHLHHAPEPREAGFLLADPSTSTLYCVDERKTDGRGPVIAASAVHVLAIQAHDGALVWQGSQPSFGAFPCYLAHDPMRRLLVSANHAGFGQVEQLVSLPEGGWATRFVYDDSTLSVFPLRPDGGLLPSSQVHLFTGHGLDPNSSPQAGGHAQSGPHAHCAVIDPSGEYLLACDKGTDRIHVFRLGAKLEEVNVLQMAPETGPRHLAFDPHSDLAFATCEFASSIATLRFDPAEGALVEIGRTSTLPPDYNGPNEPAEIRVHPKGRFVYANNRGEDCLAWFAISSDGSLSRRGAVSLARSIHPGVAARSFAFDPSGEFLLVADRPANVVRSYAVNPQTGELLLLTEHAVTDPAYVVFVEIS